MSIADDDWKDEIEDDWADYLPDDLMLDSERELAKIALGEYDDRDEDED